MIYKLVTRIIQYFCFPDRPVKGGDILDSQKGGGGILEKGGMTPFTNYVEVNNRACQIAHMVTSMHATCMERGYHVHKIMCT